MSTAGNVLGGAALLGLGLGLGVALEKRPKRRPRYGSRRYVKAKAAAILSGKEGWPRKRSGKPARKARGKGRKR